MALDGKSQHEIMNETGYHTKFVQKWMNRISPLDLPRSGRPTRVTQEHMDYIKSEMYCKVGVGYATMKKLIDTNDALSNLAKTTIADHVRQSEWGRKRLQNVRTKPLLKNINLVARQQFHSHNNTGVFINWSK